jgi:hypothetical protein
VTQSIPLPTRRRPAVSSSPLLHSQSIPNAASGWHPTLPLPPLQRGERLAAGIPRFLFPHCNASNPTLPLPPMTHEQSGPLPRAARLQRGRFPFLFHAVRFLSPFLFPSSSPSSYLPLPSRGRSQRFPSSSIARSVPDSQRFPSPSIARPVPTRWSDDGSAAAGRRITQRGIVPARRPHDASPSAATGVGRRQRGGAASSRYAFLTLKIYVPRPFLDVFRDVPVPRFGTKFPERGTRRRSAFPVTKGLAHYTWVRR